LYNGGGRNKGKTAMPRKADPIGQYIRARVRDQGKGKTHTERLLLEWKYKAKFYAIAAVVGFIAIVVIIAASPK
jgi:hypothetical protein